MRLTHRFAYWLLEWPHVQPEEREIAEERMRSNTCVCGKRKMPSSFFCGSCYRTLPLNKRRSLRLFLRRGFTFAYNDAASWLMTHPQEKKTA